MNRSANRQHKQKISDQTLNSQDSRCESKECSGESSDEDDDEDEDHSTATEESEESAGRNREWEALAKYLRRQRAYIERNPPDSFHRMPGAKKETKDKMTQKNLMSPMPSIWKPPVYKEVSAAPNFKVIKSKEIKEKESEFEDVMLRYITKLQAANNTYRNEHKKSCPHKPTTSERIKKLCSKHKKQAEYKPKRGRHEDVHACVEAGLPRLTGYVPQAKGMENPEIKKGMKIHSRCGLPIRCYRECSKRESQCDEAGKLRERLVYVVEEEEGKGVSKMETDLINVNEILAIKQDLLELSEFAKKLNRLKELKSESVKEKGSEAECQCKPLTELLRDVNKRMEALEARQEELERGIQKSRDTETDTKKTDDTKTSSVSPPLGLVQPEPSAVKSVSSFKSELSREGGGTFSKNLEIVNELLDIKSQLQKLERKRLSKELSPEIGPAGSSKNAKQKDQAINVFSSKTYILTSDQYKKKKNNKETDLEEKCPISMPSIKEKTAVCLEGQQGNDFVADWVKNISTSENPNINLKVFASPNNFIKNENKLEETWQTRSFFKKDHDRNLEGEEFGNQEPQKNRAKDTGRNETSQMSPKYNREISSYLNRKEDRLASEEFSWRSRLKERTSRDTAGNKYPSEMSPSDVKRSLGKPLKIVSSSSIPSVIAVKEELQRLKRAEDISKAALVVKPSRSKSAQEFNSTSYLSKDEKMVLNMSRKNLEAKRAQKREKENENEQVQGKTRRFPKVKKEIHLDRSRLLAAVNLDEGSTSLRKDRSRSPDIPLTIFPFPVLPPEMYKILECCEKGAKEYRVDKENWCRRESSDHRPRTDFKEKDPIKDCLEKCYKKKTRVKCSRNHCCDKKARRAASRTSRTQKDPTPSCTSSGSKNRAKKCRCKSCTQSKKIKETSSVETLSSVERKKDTECKKKEKHPRKKKKCRKCSSACKKTKHLHPSCEDPKVEEEYVEYQEKEEASATETSKENEKRQREKLQKSSLRNRKYCRPTTRPPTLHDDSCYVATFWKSLRKLYPRFSALQFMSWLKLYCQEEKQTKQNFHRKEEVATGCKPPKEKPDTHEGPDGQYCKCYRMSTFRQKWPDVNLPSKISEDKITEAETRLSNTPTETDFMFPYRKSKPFYAYKATHDEDKVDEQKKKKESTSTKKKKKKKSSSDDEGEESEERKKKKCQCDRCGHVHSRKKNKNKKKQKQKKVNYEKSSCKDTEYDVESEAASKKPENNVSEKPKKSIFSRLGDVRYLRVCDGKCPKPGAFSKSKTNCDDIPNGPKNSGADKVKGWKKWCRSDNGSSKEGVCNCESKLLELENRINNLEKEKEEKEDKEEKKKKKKKKKHKDKHESKEDHEDKERKKKKKNKEKEEGKEEEQDSTSSSNVERKKKRKKRKEEKEEEKEEEHDNDSSSNEERKKKRKKKKEEREEDSEECNCSNEEKEKKKKRKKKKKRNRSHSSEEEQVETYYCDCLNKGHKTVKKSSAPTVTTKSTSASTQEQTSTPSPSEKSSFRENLRKKKKELLEKLPSLPSFWKNFRRRKTSDDVDLLDDSSKSSAVPNARSMQPSSDEPSMLRKMKKHKKQKKDKKQKEKRVQKSKAKSRRHRFG